MNLKELYVRIKDTTGLEVLTVSDMYTLYQNCTADLKSRGYREFKEIEVLKKVAATEPDPDDEPVPVVTSFEKIDNKYVIELPSNVGKILYVKVYGSTNYAGKALRVPLTHDGIDSASADSKPRFNFGLANGHQIVYYVKDDMLYIETTQDEPVRVVIGFYAKLSNLIIPDEYTYTDPTTQEKISTTDIYNPNILEVITLPIREELQDVFVAYGVYYSYNKRLKEEETVARHLNIYKYLVEDLLFELNYEDNFNTEDSIIATEY